MRWAVILSDCRVRVLFNGPLMAALRFSGVVRNAYYEIWLLAPIRVERIELAWACDVTVTLGRLSLTTVLDHNGRTHPTKLAVGVEYPAKDNKPLNRFGGNESDCSAPIFPEFCSHSTYIVFIAPPWSCKDYYFYHSIKRSSLSWGRIVVCETTSLNGKETVVK